MQTRMQTQKKKQDNLPVSLENKHSSWYLIVIIRQPVAGILLEDVWAEDGGQRPDVPALLLKRSHAGQEAAQETQQAVVELRKLLQEVLQVSTQLLFIAVI